MAGEAGSVSLTVSCDVNSISSPPDQPLNAGVGAKRSTVRRQRSDVWLHQVQDEVRKGIRKKKERQDLSQPLDVDIPNWHNMKISCQN